MRPLLTSTGTSLMHMASPKCLSACQPDVLEQLRGSQPVSESTSSAHIFICLLTRGAGAAARQPACHAGPHAGSSPRNQGLHGRR
eukprot:598131-Pelagomonas_calceolata.AAC.2